MPIYPKRRQGVVDRVIDDERVLLDSEKGLIHKLNPTASVIWDCCDGSSDAEAICQHLAAEFGLALEQIESDVRTMIERLVELGLLDAGASEP